MLHSVVTNSPTLWVLRSYQITFTIHCPFIFTICWWQHSNLFGLFFSLIFGKLYKQRDVDLHNLFKLFACLVVAYHLVTRSWLQVALLIPKHLIPVPLVPLTPERLCSFNSNYMCEILSKNWKKPNKIYGGEEKYVLSDKINVDEKNPRNITTGQK